MFLPQDAPIFSINSTQCYSLLAIVQCKSLRLFSKSWLCWWPCKKKTTPWSLRIRWRQKDFSWINIPIWRAISSLLLWVLFIQVIMVSVPYKEWSLVNDFLSVSYLFSHFYDCSEFIHFLIQRNTLLPFISDVSSRQKYAPSLIKPVIRCINAFYDQNEIVAYFGSLLATVVIEGGMY